MPVIDEEGRLFGTVNVIDALVVLLVLAVVVAGVALVDPFGSEQEAEATRYATLDLGEQPRSVAEQISAGDRMTPKGSGNVTLTDVYVGPTNGEDVSVTARARINGSVRNTTDGESAFFYDGAQLTRGSAFNFTDTYTTNGTIRELDATGDSLNVSSTPVRVDATLSPAEARSIDSGDTMTVAGRTLATVEDIHVGPGSDGSSRRATARLTVETISRSGDLAVGSQRLGLGRTLAFDLGEYALEGDLVGIGEAASIQTHSTGVTLGATLDDDVATQVAPGDTYEVANETVATVETVRHYPGPNDDRRRVVLGVSLSGPVDDDGDRYFGPHRLRIGQSIPFETNEYAIDGEIETFGTDVETTTTKVAVESRVSTAVANTIEVGDAYEIDGQTLASVQSIDVYPTGDDGERRVLLGFDLRTIERDGESFFGSDRVSLGSTIPFETSSYELSGSVVGQGAYTPTGSLETRTVTLTVDDVDPEYADGIEVGMTERSSNETTAEIVDKQVEPASVILTSESGEIFERTHPRNVDVTLTAEIQVREGAGGYQFHARALKEGSTVTLDFGTIDVRADVTEIHGES